MSRVRVQRAVFDGYESSHRRRLGGREMTRGVGATEVFVGSPQLLECGAYLSQRVRSATCQKCYGRRKCRCSRKTRIPCIAGTHYATNPKRNTTTGRLNRAFVDINHNQRGIR